MIINSNMKIIWRWSRRMMRFKIVRRWFIRLRSGGITIYSRFWSIVRIKRKGIIGKRKIKSTRFKRRGGDKDAILEKSSSSGLIVTILFGEKVKMISSRGGNYTNVRLGKVIPKCVFYLEKII